MKKMILFSLMTLLAFTAFASAEISPQPNLLSLTSKIALATLGGALLTAVNHVVAMTFDFKIWLADTLVPALIAFGISMALGLIDIYSSVADRLVESIFGISTDANDASSLAMTALVLVPLIKGFFKRSQTKAKVH